MQVVYPLSHDQLNEAMQQFADLVWQRNPHARISLREDQFSDLLIIAIETPGHMELYSLNAVTGDWMRQYHG